MKYGQFVVGLLAGVAVVALAQSGVGGGGTNRAQVESIVKEVIAKEPQLILDSVQKFQMEKRNQATADAGKALQDSELKKPFTKTKTRPSLAPKTRKSGG